MRDRQEQQSSQSDTSNVVTELGAIRKIMESMEQKLDSYISAMGALHRDVVALLESQQTLLSIVLPPLLAQMNDSGDRASTSHAPGVCLRCLPQHQHHLLQAKENTHQRRKMWTSPVHHRQTK